MPISTPAPLFDYDEVCADLTVPLLYVDNAGATVPRFLKPFLQGRNTTACSVLCQATVVTQQMVTNDSEEA